MTIAERPIPGPAEMPDAAIPAPDNGTVRPPASDVGPIVAVDLLIDEARAAVEHEIALVKAYAAAAGYTARNVAILSAVAILLALVALMATAVGAMLALSVHFGIALATVIVGGILLLLVAILSWMIRAQIKKFRDAAAGVNSA